MIEILVVVAIIALLITILLPSLQRAREQARRMVCSANQRTCAQALMMYCQLSQEFFPTVKRPNVSTNNYPDDFACQPWEVLYKYIQKGLPTRYTDYTSIFNGAANAGNTTYLAVEYYLCPSDKIHHTTSQANQTLPDGTVIQGEFVLSYSVNADLMGPRSETNSIQRVWKLSTVKNASMYVVFAGSGDDTESGADYWEMGDRNDLNNQIGFETRHLGGTDVTYLDGHGEFARRTKTSPQLGIPAFPWAWLPLKADYKIGDPGNDSLNAWFSNGGRKVRDPSGNVITP